MQLLKLPLFCTNGAILFNFEVLFTPVDTPVVRKHGTWTIVLSLCMDED